MPGVGRIVNRSGRANLLGDVPQIALIVERQHPVRDGDAVEVGVLLVPEEDVRSPDLLPAPDAELDLSHVLLRVTVLEWFEAQAGVPPRLAQVEADRVVLE